MTASSLHTLEEEEPILKNPVSPRIYRQGSMSQRIDRSDTCCFDCVYMYQYTVNPCSHTTCNTCFQIQLQQKTFVCPRCPDLKKCQNDLRIMAEKKHIREQHKAESVSRKQLSPLQLILKYDCKNIVPRIDETLQDITDLNERKRVQKVLWKNWFLFIEPVETKKVEKILRRQRTQYEYHRQRELFIGNDCIEKLSIKQQVEEEQECDGLDQQAQHRRESLCVERSLPAVNFNIQAKSDSFWPDGTESWHIRELRPQRQSFTNRIDSEQLSIAEPIANVECKRQPLEQPVNLELNPVELNSVEPNQIEPNLIELNPNSVETNPLEPDPTQTNLLEPNTIAPHPLTSRPNPLIKCFIESNMVEKRPSLGQLQVDIRTHVDAVTSVREYVRTFTRTPESINIWYDSKPCQRRLKSTSRGRSNDSSPLTSFSPKTQSHDCFHSRFLWQISTYLVKTSLFLLSILFGFRIVHLSVHDSDGIDSRSPTTASAFVVDMVTSTCSLHTFKTLTPYFTTIEMLRALESLLIYAIT